MVCARAGTVREAGGAVGKRCAVWDVGAWGALELMPGLRGDVGTGMG